MSRTMIVGWVSVVAGFLGLIGFDLPVGALEAVVGTVFDSFAEGYMIVSGAAIIFLRKITSGPVAEGIMGLLGKK